MGSLSISMSKHRLTRHNKKQKLFRKRYEYTIDILQQTINATIQYVITIIKNIKMISKYLDILYLLHLYQNKIICILRFKVCHGLCIEYRNLLIHNYCLC